MKNKIDIRSLVIGTLLGAVIMFSVAAATSSTSRTVWEYKIIPSDLFQGQLDKAINSAVVDGWDFVSTSHLNEHWAFAVLRREKK